MLPLASLFAALALAAAAPAHADASGGPPAGRDGALAACEAAALAEMQARHPDAVQVQALEDQVAVTETPAGQIEVAGGGQFAPEVGVWTPFTYTCAYSPTTRQVTSLALP